MFLYFKYFQYSIEISKCFHKCTRNSKQLIARVQNMTSLLFTGNSYSCTVKPVYSVQLRKHKQIKQLLKENNYGIASIELFFLSFLYSLVKTSVTVNLQCRCLEDLCKFKQTSISSIMDNNHP